MSGECEYCGEHCLDCKCKEAWENIPYDIRLRCTLHLFNAIVDLLDNPRSFRSFIYGSLGFKPQDYVPLYKAGGMAITNGFHDLNELYNRDDDEKD